MARTRKVPLEIRVLAAAADGLRRETRVGVVPACITAGGPQAGFAFRRPVRPGFSLVHWTPAIGRMEVLLVCGTWCEPTRRVSFRQTRFLGAAADAERFYAAVWDSDRIFDQPPAADEVLTGGTYSLRVFRLGDGWRCESPVLSGPPSPSEETLDAGVLTAAADGVTLFGVTHRYKDVALVK